MLLETLVHPPLFRLRSSWWTFVRKRKRSEKQKCLRHPHHNKCPHSRRYICVVFNQEGQATTIVEAIANDPLSEMRRYQRSKTFKIECFVCRISSNNDTHVFVCYWIDTPIQYRTCREVLADMMSTFLDLGTSMILNTHTQHIHSMHFVALQPPRNHLGNRPRSK